MGNDIKLPVSQRKEVSESQRNSEAEARTQLNFEIAKIANEIASVSNQVDKIEHELIEINRNIDYYKKLIADMSINLHQIRMEQINANLTHENYVERAKWYLESLKEFSEESAKDEADEYSLAKLAHLEETVAILNTEVIVNDDIIEKKMKKVLN